jgi:hypothetical protein
MTIITTAAAPPPAIPQVLTFRQVLIGLVAESWITEAEGEAWLGGVLPAAVLALIAALPAEQRFAVRATAARFTEAYRADPLIAMMAAAAGKAESDLDAFFTAYAAV